MDPYQCRASTALNVNEGSSSVNCQHTHCLCHCALPNERRRSRPGVHDRRVSRTRTMSRAFSMAINAWMTDGEMGSIGVWNGQTPAPSLAHHSSRRWSTQQSGFKASAHTPASKRVCPVLSSSLLVIGYHADDAASGVLRRRPRHDVKDSCESLYDLCL
jgi:hypothetical protein